MPSGSYKLAGFTAPDTTRSESGMLDRNIFGSTLSLGGLLNESLFSDGEADQFLQEMGVESSRGFGEPAVAEAHSGASSFESTLSGNSRHSCLWQAARIENSVPRKHPLCHEIFRVYLCYQRQKQKSAP